MCTANDRSLINVQQGLLLVDKGPVQFNVYENNSTPKSLKRKGGEVVCMHYNLNLLQTIQIGIIIK